MDELDNLSFNNYNNNISPSNLHQQQQHQVIPPHLWTTNSNQSSLTPTTLSTSSLPNLIFDSLDGFCFVINSNGLIQFTSENVVNYIKYSQVRVRFLLSASLECKLYVKFN